MPWDHHQAQTLIGEFDKDRDGILDQSEFAELVLPQYYDETSIMAEEIDKCLAKIIE